MSNTSYELMKLFQVQIQFLLAGQEVPDNVTRDAASKLDKLLSWTTVF